MIKHGAKYLIGVIVLFSVLFISLFILWISSDSGGSNNASSEVEFSVVYNGENSSVLRSYLEGNSVIQSDIGNDAGLVEIKTFQEVSGIKFTPGSYAWVVNGSIKKVKNDGGAIVIHITNVTGLAIVRTQKSGNYRRLYVINL